MLLDVNSPIEGISTLTRLSVRLRSSPEEALNSHLLPFLTISAGIKPFVENEGLGFLKL